MFNYKSRTDWFLFFVILVSFGVAFYFWPSLPDRVPTHWGFNGQVDGWGPKWMGLFLMPSISFLVFFGMNYLPKLDPLKKNYKDFKKEYEILKALLVILFTIMYVIVLFSTFNETSDIMRFFFPLMFSIFIIIIGYLMPSFKANWFVGIKTPWTLTSKKSWEETHKLAGKLFILTGLATIVTSIFSTDYSFATFMVLILIAAIVPFIYSYIIWKKDKNKEK